MKCLVCVQYSIAEEVQRKRQNSNPEGVCVLIQELNIPKKSYKTELMIQKSL